MIDASRVVGVVSSLLDPERKIELDRQNRELQETLRRQHAEREKTPLLPYRKAREHRTEIGWRAEDLPVPSFTGTRVVEPALAELRDTIDWTFFFTAWELKGRFPPILDHPAHGAAARELFDHATELLDQIVAEGCSRRGACTGSGPPTPRATTSCWTTGSCSRCSASRPTPATTDRTARSPIRGAGRDRVARPHRRRSPSPRASDVDDARQALRGRPRRLPRDHGEGARRPARRGVRREAAPGGPAGLGYQLETPAERRADRGAVPRDPARVRLPGLPRPQREAPLFDLLDAREHRDGPHGVLRHDARRHRSPGCTSRIRKPGTSTSGGSAKDQVEDYARRKGESITEAERWLRPNLAYDTD